MTVSKRAPISAGAHAERDGGVQQPRAVEVDAEVRLARDGDDRVDLVERPDAPAGDVVRVLERRATAGRWSTTSSTRDGRGAHLLRRQAAARARAART